MNGLLCNGLWALSTLGIFSGSTPTQTREPVKFVDWEWGTPFAQLNNPLGLEPLHTDGRMVRYSSGVRIVRSVPVTDCQFEFSRDSLSGIALTTHGIEHSRRMLTLLQSAFGRGLDDPPLGFQWLTKDSNISYNEDSVGDACVYLYSIRYQNAGVERKKPPKE
jgi:hypothetical protein